MNRPKTLQRAIKLILFAMPLAVIGNIVYTALTAGNTGFQAILGIPWFWLALALFFSLTPWIFAILRVKTWNSFFNLKLSHRDLFEIVLANDVAAAATPTAVGGGYAKIGLLIYHGVKPGLSASLMVIGSLEDYVSMALVVPICWLLSPPEHISLQILFNKIFLSASHLNGVLPVTVITVSSAAIFVWAIPATRGFFIKTINFGWWQKKIVKPLKGVFYDFGQAFALISKGGKLLFAMNVLLAAIQWIMRYSIFTIMAAGLGLHPHPVSFFLLQWLVFMFMNFVPTPGAIGGAEVVFALVFKGTVPPELIPVAAGAWRFVSTYLQLMIAALLMIIIEKPSLKSKHRASVSPS
ncbi:MAG: UPF0104 family protein [Calditrichaeota bacterium]|nr:MAG: UPF0104 family protein [Calditrichota bacterium]